MGGLASVPNVLLQHAQEAAFLWLLRSEAALAPHYSLADLAKLDDRVEAHLDGLRVAGQAGWKCCADQLAVNEVGEVFAAAVLAFESGDKARIAQVLEAGTTESGLANGVISVLGWLNFERVAGDIAGLLASETGALRRIGLGACAAHRQCPAGALWQLLRDKDASVRARAMRALGELGKLDLIQDADAATSSDDPEVRFWSSWSVALLTGAPSALAFLKSVAPAASKRQELALELVIRRLPPSDAKSWQRQLMQKPEQVQRAIAAAGALGDPEAVPWLLDQMIVIPRARRAGEAFTNITGVDLAFRDLERKSPADFDSGPTEDPKDENVEMDPDDNLPWPDPALVKSWWDKNRSQFANGTRYILGKPLETDWLKTVLRNGRQRQRAAAALELAIRNPGQPLFNVKAPGFRQVQVLGKPGEPIQ